MRSKRRVIGIIIAIVFVFLMSAFHSGAERRYIMEDRKEIYGEWIFICWRLYWRGMSDQSYIWWKDHRRHVSGDSIL